MKIEKIEDFSLKDITLISVEEVQELSVLMTKMAHLLQVLLT